MKGEVLWNTLKINVHFCHDNVSDLLISYSYLKVVDAMQVVPVLEMRKECCQMELNVSLALMQLLQYRCDPIMRFYRLVQSQHDFQSWENLIPQICIASGLSVDVDIILGAKMSSIIDCQLCCEFIIKLKDTCCYNSGQLFSGRNPWTSQAKVQFPI